MEPALKRLAAFFVRRLTAATFTLLTLIAITFIVYWALPSTPATFLYSPQHLTAYQISNANHLLGLDRPKIVQFADYVWHLAGGNLGRQWTDAQLRPGNTLVQQPIGAFMYPALGATMSIILGGAFFVLLLSVPLGALAGSRVGSLSDRTISIVALVGVATHPMVLGSVLKTGFAHLGVPWPPIGGYCPLFPGAGATCGGPVDWAGRLALPWLTFALLFLALYTRMIRTSVAETLHEDFVSTARAKGAGEAREGRGRSARPARARAPERGAARPDDGGDGDRHGDRCVRLHRGGVRHLRSRTTVGLCDGRSDLGDRPTLDARGRVRDHAHRRRREPGRRPALCGARSAHRPRAHGESLEELGRRRDLGKFSWPAANAVASSRKKSSV
ncbi:MAG TPA: ABC transporter permease [Gaiellaceae bacterium]|nr:ABC transporter permease [Gaiellaceae bacterium]